MPTLNWGSNYAFSPYSVKHAAVLLVLAALAVGVVAVGRWLAPVTRRASERIIGLLLVAVWLTGLTFDAINPRASASTTLPLHWCDVCGGLAAFVMFFPQYRLPRAILHFWALGICTFAFVLPVIGLGPALFDFWIYFGTHAAIVLTAVYDRGVRDFVPTVRDLAHAWGAAVLWTLILQPINLSLGANYGFVGADDRSVRKAIRALGAWPWRLGPMLGLELAIMTTMLLTQQTAASVVAKVIASRRPYPQSLPFPTSLPERSHAKAA